MQGKTLIEMMEEKETKDIRPFVLIFEDCVTPNREKENIAAYKNMFSGKARIKFTPYVGRLTKEQEEYISKQQPDLIITNLLKNVREFEYTTDSKTRAAQIITRLLNIMSDYQEYGGFRLLKNLKSSKTPNVKEIPVVIADYHQDGIDYVTNKALRLGAAAVVETSYLMEHNIPEVIPGVKVEDFLKYAK